MASRCSRSPTRRTLHPWSCAKQSGRVIEWDERVLERDETGAPVTRWDSETMKPVTGKPVPESGNLGNLPPSRH